MLGGSAVEDLHRAAVCVAQPVLVGELLGDLGGVLGEGAIEDGGPGSVQVDRATIAVRECGAGLNGRGLVSQEDA